MNNSQVPYGFELIMDLHGCDASTFNRESLDGYFEELCKAIDMVKCERYWWDDVGVTEEERQTSPHTKGTSAVQFILTSTIVVHTLELLKAAYINIFSCKAFNENVAERVTKEWFGANGCKTHFIERI
jgi:S-adenosylmethionine/arginine decarboxylase-like enzyme